MTSPERTTGTARGAAETLRWVGQVDGHLQLIDQTRLPRELKHLDCHDAETVWEAIRSLRVRGAPAIGIAAAYGVCLGLQPLVEQASPDLPRRVCEVTDYLASSRPTAVNLFWALDRMRAKAETVFGQPLRVALSALLDEARQIHDEDRAICHAIGRHGARLLRSGQGVITHCNAGGLATSEYGTALAVLFTAQDEGRELHVFVDETRPLLQGSRLTAWELMRRGIETTLICDAAAAQVMREGRVQTVITGADRIAANGDAANKIGTYGLAVLAAAHDLPFYIAAPRSTFDLAIASGREIPIEQRPPEEVTRGFGRQTAPAGVSVYNPAFDVTPASLIRGIITEYGLIEPVTADRIRQVLAAT
jgi:methylthioribose-1-phosphate isomerase